MNELVITHLQTAFPSLQSFAAYDLVYGTVQRLGYTSAMLAWNKNPQISAEIPERYLPLSAAGKQVAARILCKRIKT